MYAALIEIDVSDVDEERGLPTLRERIVPAIAAMPGFHSGTWLTGNADGKGMSLTVWESESSAQAMADRFPVGASPQEGSEVLRCEVRVVAANA